MNKNIHPVAAFAVILVCLVVGAIWLWSGGQAKTYGGPAGLTTDPDGHLYIQIQNQLLEHDSRGEFIKRHDLSEFGVDLLLGGTAFFSNGDILIRLGRDTRTLFDNVRAFQRLTNEASVTADTPGTGLFRCNLDTKQCSIFGSNPIDFKSAFSVFIDQHTDDVYISDSSRHLVRKYDRDGVEIAQPVSGFKFPNRLMLHEQALLVTDTNHHRILAVQPNTRNFGEEIYVADVVPAKARADDRIWPSHFALVGDEWWVNNMKSGMNYGSIYIFDSNWDFKREISPPGKADPISILAFNGEVLISDWYGDRIHRFSTSGTALGDFQSPGLTAVLDVSMLERRRYMLYGWLAVAFGFMLVVGVIIKGTAWSEETSPLEKDEQPDSLKDPILLEPDPKNVEKLQKNQRMARWLLLPAFSVIPLVVANSGDVQQVIELAFAGIAFVVIFALVEWMNRVNKSSAIRLEGSSVTLSDHSGHTVYSPLSNVFFTDNFVVSDDVAVFLGQPNMPIYDKEHVLEVLAKRLPSSQRISQWAMQKKLFAMRHPIGIIGIMTIVMLFIFAIVLAV